MNTVFAGEHALPGQLGHFFVILAFVFSLLGSIAYAISVRQKDEQLSNPYFRIGRLSFFVMGMSVIGIIVTLFSIIYNHQFEYYYAWRHASKALPTHYMLSCFWEGQEGSFLLWMFWQLVMGAIIVWKDRKWEASVMAILLFSQFFMASMLLGVFIKLPNLFFWTPDFLHLFSYRIGSNPFQLLRWEMANAPIFQQANYMDFVKDGNGLNPLLQNYWMVIHPPVLFLGFASTIVPAAYAMAGFWKKEYDAWTKPAFSWSLFSGGVLSLGIMMGAAWAYEALTFGGYWAWDPVENASLMPWLTLLAGIHTLIAYRHTKHALMATFLFFVGTFVLVLYASFLTRSGILGETSVHAFTDLGLGGQLVFFILAFFIPFIWMSIKHWKGVAAVSAQKEEAIWSREFWLFIGSLVLLVSVIQVTFTTSIPVFNKVFGTKLAPPVNAVEHYNKIQVWVGILLGILSASVQFLRYKQSEWKQFLKSISWMALLSVLMTAFCVYVFRFNKASYWVFFFAGFFAITANLQYLITKVKTKFISWGGSLSHIGFGMMLVGILISSFNQRVVSINQSGIDPGEGFDEKAKMENILLYKNVPVMMSGYEVTYLGDSTVEPNIYYKVHYVKRDKDGKITEEFFLHPNAQINPKMGLISSPDTRHYITHDVYTHITSVPDNSKDKQTLDSKDFSFHQVKAGDTIQGKDCKVVFKGIAENVERKDVALMKEDIAVSARFEVIGTNRTYPAEALYIIRNKTSLPIAGRVDDLGVQLFVNQIMPDKQLFDIAFGEHKPAPEYVVMKALDFPYINVLWMGVIVLVVGFSFSLVKRIRKNSQPSEA